MSQRRLYTVTLVLVSGLISLTGIVPGVAAAASLGGSHQVLQGPAASKGGGGGWCC